MIQLKIEGLNNEKSLIETKLHTKTPPKVKEKEENEGVILSLYNDFCEFVSTTLKDWEFSVNTGVTFKDGIFMLILKQLRTMEKDIELLFTVLLQFL